MKLIVRIIGISITIYSLLFSGHIHKEKWYQNIASKKLNGTTEVVIPHGRVDILTSKYAIEVDFDTKCYESIGQAMYYSTYTGKAPGVVLITERFSKRGFKCRQIMKYLSKRSKFALWFINKNGGIKRWK